jgi:hypothetical protein
VLKRGSATGMLVTVRFVRIEVIGSATTSSHQAKLDRMEIWEKLSCLLTGCRICKNTADFNNRIDCHTTPCLLQLKA